MNECILFANIGNSDIRKNNQILFSIKHGEKINVYEKSKKLYKSGNFKDIELIILEPTISKIMENYKIKKIFLFATEQLRPNQQDTKYCAEIAKKILCDKYKFSEEEIQILQISENPADYDEMFEYYQRKIEEIKKNTDIKNENTCVYVSLTGGTPAQTTALLFWSILKFRNLIIPIYKPNKKGESAKELDIGSNIYKILLGERLESLESKKFYTSAAELAKEFKLKNDYEIKWLEAKAKRSLFDFDGELKFLEECKKLQISPQKKRDIENRIAEIKILIEKKDKKALIMELYENMKVVWEHGAYTDFIGRLFRFEEAVYYYLVLKKLGVDISIKSKHQDFVKKIEMDKNLSSFLTSQKYGGQPLKMMIVDRPLLFFILSYYKEEFGIIVNIFNKINDYTGSPDNSLGNLRNKSILAHGFEGVSKEKIIEKYKSGELMNDIEKIVNFIQNKY